MLACPERRRAMPDYRRSERENVWHWCHECSKWPTYDYEVSHTKPVDGQFCQECNEKAPLKEQTDVF
jgi:hypothetical protein